MDYRIKLWNSNQKLLRNIILKPSKFDEAIYLCLEQHAMVHSSKMSQIDTRTFEDDLWVNLDEKTARLAVNKKGRTAVYGIWHSTRIEDITMNILVAEDIQVINTNNWLNRINSTITDTGNALSSKEILDFSKKVNIEELKNYRVDVGRKSRRIITNLTHAKLKEKMKKDNLKRILEEKAVLDVEESNWLIDFWGRKNVAGILLMPITRHHLVHINESIEAKKSGIK